MTDLDLDLELVAAAKAGDQDAFTELHKRHASKVRSTGRAVLKTDDLDDFCQDVFLLAFMRIGSFKGNAKFSTWIIRIALNECLMRLRRYRQITNGDCNLVSLSAREDDDQSVVENWWENTAFSIEDRSLSSVGARFDLSRLMATLVPAHRRIVTLAYLDGWNDLEVSEIVGMTLPAVKSILHHSKKRMKSRTF